MKTNPKSATQKTREPRNPGPIYGYQIIHYWDKFMPSWLSHFVLAIGAGVAVILMPKQRKASRTYLTAILKKRVRFYHVWRHFYNLTYYLTERIHASRGKDPSLRIVNGRDNTFESFMRTSKQFLLGSFHVGYSDLLGFYLREFERKVYMVRLKVANSSETESLIAANKDYLEIIWANDRHDITFQLMEVLANSGSLALQCDRVEHASKLENFYFLNHYRSFPFTIYHLSAIYKIPLCFCFALYERKTHEVQIYPSEVFHPKHEPRSENLKAGKAHFQKVLNELESLLQKYPYQWYNFIPLNPIVEPKSDVNVD